MKDLKKKTNLFNLYFHEKLLKEQIFAQLFFLCLKKLPEISPHPAAG